MTSLQRRGSESTSFLSCSGVTTRNQAAITCSISSLLILGLFLPTIQLTQFHKFSIGLKLGDWAGQSIRSTLWVPYQCCSFLVRWHGTLSSWNIQSSSENKERALDSIWFFSTSMHFVPFILPETSLSLPMPLAAMQSHTIIDCGCLMVDEMQYGQYSSSDLLLT